LPLGLPTAFIGKTLKELDLRAKYNVTVLAVRTQKASTSRDYLPEPEQPLRQGDTLILAGHQEALHTFQHNFSASA
jgi:trk system potassium uptake protein TrkA